MDTVLDKLILGLPLLPAVLVILAAMVASRLMHRILTRHAGPGTRAEFRLQIAHLIIGLSTTIVVLVVIPVGPELRGQLLSLFGIMLSAAIAFASTTFVGNVMAGMMLKAVRNFRTGDFIRINDQFGRVTERGLLSTEIQTEDRDLVTLPNLILVTNPVKVVRSSGTVISAEVSLGFDVHHETIEQALLAAAEEAKLADPFVLVMELGDFSVLYRVAGLLEEVTQLLSARSRLRVCMLDHLHRNGVEIVSPNFMNQRVLDPAEAIIPSSPAASSPEPNKKEAKVEAMVFDKAEEAVSLDNLQRDVEKTRHDIAALADPPPGSDPEQVRRQQEMLARKLAHLEEAIAAEMDREKRDDDNEPSE